MLRWLGGGGGVRWLAGGGLGGWEGLVCFSLLQTHNVKYLSEHFPRMQTNIEKKLFSLKSFAFENILQCKMFYIETNEALGEIILVTANTHHKRIRKSDRNRTLITSPYPH